MARGLDNLCVEVKVMSECEFCQENHCVDESFPCSCRGPGGVCQATPDDLIEACCPDPACCYAGWDGRHCDCGAECEGCQVGAIMRAPDVRE